MSPSPSASVSVLTALPPPAPQIPAAFTQSVRSWWSNVGFKQSQMSELRILLRVPYFSKYSKPPSTTPGAPLTVISSLVPLSTPKQYINTLAMNSTNPDASPDAPPPVVMLHGYGAGLGFYFRNFPTMAHWAERRRSSVYAIDWLGMGRSARVPFVVKAKRGNVEERVEGAESFFIDSLEEWRKQMGLDRMTLIGHSLGAYLSVAYTLKHPERVAKLILLSPAGVPRGPNFTEVSRELTDHGSEPERLDHSEAEPATQGKVSDLRSSQKRNLESQSLGRKIFTYLWEEGWSPFQVVRSTLFWGPLLVGKYSSRRFQGLSDEDTRDLHDYILNITLAKGSGEYCISHLLEPGAHARMPIVDRIAGVKVPVTFVYGDNDWMDPVGGMQSVEKLRRAGNGEGKMYIVNNAGHHVYLDNPEAVNALLVKELDKEHRKQHPSHPTPTRIINRHDSSQPSPDSDFHDFY